MTPEIRTKAWPGTRPPRTLEMKISKAKPEDAEEILELQKRAYRSEAELYDAFDMPPLKQTLDELRSQFTNHVILKAVSKDKIVGTVRAYEENGACHIGRLAVHPDAQNQGIGTALLEEIEKYYECQRFELFAGGKSHKNISLYKKLGYAIVRTSSVGPREIEIVHMEKLSTSRL